MYMFLKCLLLLASLSLGQVQTSSTSSRTDDWVLDGSGKDAYVMEATGRATEKEGAKISLRCLKASSKVFGAVSTKLSAESFRGCRGTLSAELQTKGAKGGASLWLKVYRGTEVVNLADGLASPQLGDTAWIQRTVSLPVFAQATSIALGVILQPGGGSVAVRGLRLQRDTQIGATSDVVLEVLDAAIAIVKNNAWKASSVNWDVVEPEVRSIAAGAKQSSEAYAAIRILLARLGDRHSFLMPPAQTSAFKMGGLANPPIDVRVISDGVGYIKVPPYFGVEPTAMRAFATRAHEALSATMRSAKCGWVLDLRENGGGNVWPMLAALKPLLGDAVLGTFEGPRGSGTKWIAGSGVGADPPTSLKALQSAWVAVLTGPKTASSGEAIAVAFRGRPNTRSFGLPTAGLSTANRTFPLPDGDMIVLTTSVAVDRTGRRYGDKINPDERIEAGGSTAAVIDATLDAAIKWLTPSGCRKESSE